MPDIVDARGLKCPLPVLKTEKRLARLKPGESLVVLATDPLARVDIPHLCHGQGLSCTVTEDSEGFRFEIGRDA